MGQSDNELQIGGLVGLLERGDPTYLREVRSRHPSLADRLTSERTLGDKGDSIDSFPAVTEVAERALQVAKGDGERCLQRIQARARTIARFRLASSILTSISAAGIVGVLVGEADLATARITAFVALATSLATTAAQYWEQHVGGKEALAGLRSEAMQNLLEVTELEGLLRLNIIEGNRDGALEVVRRANVIAAKIRKNELALA